MLAEFEKALVVNQKLQITVWDPADERKEFHYHSYVMDIDKPFIKLAPPTKQVEEITKCLQVGIVAGVVLEAYPTPFIFYPIMHSKQEPPQPGFWFKIPENAQIETMQRRRHVRIPMVVPITVDYAIGDKTVSMPARTEDVSGGGLRFTSPRLFNKEQEILVHLRIESEHQTVHVKGKVVFSAENRVRKQPDDLYATACEFFDLDERQEVLLIRECFRREVKRPV